MSKKRSFKAVALGSIAVFTFLAIIGRKEEAKPVEPTEAELLEAELKVIRLKRQLAEEQAKNRQREADAVANTVSVEACGKLDTPEKRMQFWERERQRFIDAGEIAIIAESHATNSLAKRLLAESR